MCFFSLLYGRVHSYTYIVLHKVCKIKMLVADLQIHVPNILDFQNVFSFEGHYCLVFELLRPRPLHQYFQVGCKHLKI